MANRSLTLLLAIAMTCGCGFDRGQDGSYADYPSENPPPKPPNCPDLPELRNLAIGGRFADVRIVEVSEIKLYIPSSWFRDKFPDDYKYQGKVMRSTLGVFAPDLHRVECPGVVHRFVDSENIFDMGFGEVDVRGDRPKAHNPNISALSRIRMFAIVRPRGVADPKAAPAMFKDHIMDWPTTATTSAHVVVVPERLVVVYRWPKADPVDSPRWISARDSIVELVDWLRTPPTHRDEKRIFLLGAY